MGEMKLPGQELERAAADVASNAGNNLVAAIGRRLKAWSARSSVADEQYAETEALKAQLERNALSVDARRALELQEVEHRRALEDRGLGRMRAEIEKSQEQVEHVSARSVQITEADPENASEARIDEDWLDTFFKYVAQVDEAHVLEILAQALSDEAIGRPRIPAKALDTIRFFDVESYSMFLMAARMLTLFESLPDTALDTLARRKNIAFDTTRLEDLGLIVVENRRGIAFSLGNARYVMGYKPGERFELKVVRLTFAGKAIARLISPAQRQLVDANAASAVVPGAIWQLQSAVGIEEVDVQTVAQTLLQQLSDTWGIQTRFTAPGIEDLQPADFAFERNALAEHFAYGPARGMIGLEEANLRLLSVFIDAFEDFDENELPAIVAHAE